MITESTKKIVVGIIAMTFISIAFLPAVQSELGFFSQQTTGNTERIRVHPF